MTRCVLLFPHTSCFVLIWTCGRALVPTGHPGPTPHRPPLHTHPQYQLHVQVCVLAFLPAEAQLCLNATTECQSISVVPVTHTAGLRSCVGTVSSMSVMRAPLRLCNPHTERKRRLPRAAPTPAHLPSSVPLSASCCPSLYLL